MVAQRVNTTPQLFPIDDRQQSGNLPRRQPLSGW
jgi:hypothetical protein